MYIYIYIYSLLLHIYIYGYPKIWWFMTIVPVEIVIGHHMRGSPWIPWPARHWAILWRRQSLQCERPRLQGVVPICASPYSACFIFAWLVRTEKTSRCQWRVVLGFIVLFFLVSQLVCAFSMIIYGCVFAGDGQYRPVTVLASPVSLVMFFSQICWWDAFLVPYIIYPISIDISTLMDSHNIHTYVHL